jgi:hypothetical protein
VVKSEELAPTRPMLLDASREPTAMLQADIRALNGLFLVRLARRLSLILLLVVLRLVLARSGLTRTLNIEAAAKLLVRLLVQIRHTLAVGSENRGMGRLESRADSAGSCRGIGSRRSGWSGRRRRSGHTRRIGSRLERRVGSGLGCRLRRGIGRRLRCGLPDRDTAESPAELVVAVRFGVELRNRLARRAPGVMTVEVLEGVTSVVPGSKFPT